MTEREIVDNGDLAVRYLLTNANLYKNDVFSNGLCSFYISCTKLFRLVDENADRRVFFVCKNLTSNVRSARWLDQTLNSAKINENPFCGASEVVIDATWIADHVTDKTATNVHVLKSGVRMIAVNCGPEFIEQFATVNVD